MVWSGPHAGWILGQIIGTQVLFSQIYHGRHLAPKRFFRYQGCHRIIWMSRQSFLGGECTFHYSGCQVMISAEGMKAAREAKGQTGWPIRIDVWKQKRKTDSPFLILAGKKLYMLHILFTTLTSNMPRWKTDMAGLCAGCVWLVKEFDHS